MNSTSSQMSKRSSIFPTLGFWRTTQDMLDIKQCVYCGFSFIRLQVVSGILLANIYSAMSLKRKQQLKTWRGLANCLHIAGAGTLYRTNASFANDVLRFIHRNGFLIVPPSNPPTPQQIKIPALSKTPGRNTRDLHASSRRRSSNRCPFKITVVDFVNTVPRFLSKATCDGCDAHCKPVIYTHRSGVN